MTTTETTRTENDAVAELATRALQAEKLGPGDLYGTIGPDGTLHVTDLEKYDDGPRRKRGTVTALDGHAFAAYVLKHSSTDTEIWSDPAAGQLVAVLNAHGDEAGWGDHRVRLGLKHTPAWKAWIEHDRQMRSQVDFAEQVEDRLVDFVEPAGAVMLELAQTFSGKRSVRFESSKRLASGETQLQWKEDETAQAGRKGDIAIPDAFTLGLKPYEGGQPYKVRARLRYRIGDGGRLALGYVIDRPDEILRAAFDDLVNLVSTELPDHTIWNGQPQ